MLTHECKEQLYRETGHSIYSQEKENSGAVTRNGIFISAASTGNRVAIDMFATTDIYLKIDAEV